MLNYIKRVRRYIHQNPELGFNTYNTAKFIYDELKALNFSPIYELDGAAVMCMIDNNKDKTIAFRADIDALAIKEDNNLEYKSVNDNMHACGHDGHAAIVLGLAKMIRENLDNINVNIVLIFQPAEEGPLPGGAFYLKDHPYLANIEAFYAFHVTQKLYNNQIGLKYGPATASPDLWELELTGVGCHASTPSLGNNPILCGAKIITALETHYQNLLKENIECVITSTYFNAGVSMNIIKDKCYLKGTARSFNDKTRNLLATSMHNIIKEIALKDDIKYDFKFYYAYPSVYNDKNLCDNAINNAKKIYKEENIIIFDKAELIGEDFAYYGYKAPTCFIWLGVRDYDSPFYDLHNPCFLVNEESLLNGTKLLLEIILNY